MKGMNMMCLLCFIVLHNVVPWPVCTEGLTSRLCYSMYFSFGADYTVRTHQQDLTSVGFESKWLWNVPAVRERRSVSHSQATVCSLPLRRMFFKSKTFLEGYEKPKNCHLLGWSALSVQSMLHLMILFLLLRLEVLEDTQNYPKVWDHLYYLV